MINLPMLTRMIKVVSCYRFDFRVTAFTHAYDKTQAREKQFGFVLNLLFRDKMI